MQQFAKNLNDLPVAVSGLALGLAGMGNLLAIEINSTARYICASLAALILLLVLLKKMLHPRLLWQEISHPVLGSFIPAFDMALMVLAEIFTNFSLISGQILWYFAIILHLFFATCFIYFRLKDFDLNHMLPSWFVPPVGIVVACVTGASMQASWLTHPIFYCGCVLYLLILPVMLYRLIFGDRIIDAQLPSFAIMGAPASLCLAGYLTAFKHPNLIVLGILLAIALMMTALVYISMVRINHLRVKFIPIYASFTFPLAIGATALMKYAAFIGLDNESGILWHYLGQTEMYIALAVLAWVLWNMCIYVLKHTFKYK